MVEVAVVLVSVRDVDVSVVVVKVTVAVLEESVTKVEVSVSVVELTVPVAGLTVLVIDVPVTVVEVAVALSSGSLSFCKMSLAIWICLAFGTFGVISLRFPVRSSAASCSWITAASFRLGLSRSIWCVLFWGCKISTKIENGQGSGRPLYPLGDRVSDRVGGGRPRLVQVCRRPSARASHRSCGKGSDG